ncbi:MAG: hypothetical protein K2X93_28875 [Candidatus Obscuribacterales bacterium]|nr:hypothetical protein [Candidatus Obscuribacterales bacterium]
MTLFSLSLVFVGLSLLLYMGRKAFVKAAYYIAPSLWKLSIAASVVLFIMGIVWDIHYNVQSIKSDEMQDQLTVIPPPATEPQYLLRDDHRAEDNKREIEKYIAGLDKIIEKNRFDAESYKERGWAYSDLGDFKRALKDLSSSIRIHPTADAYCKRAWVHVTLGEKGQAAGDAASALKIEPENEDALDARGQ